MMTIKFRVIPNKLSNLAKFQLRREGRPVKAHAFTVVATDGYWKAKEKHVYSSEIEAVKLRLAEKVKRWRAG
jgi:hypothetical protein